MKQIIQAFNVNVLRFKNFRMRAARAYEREANAIKDVVDNLKEQQAALVRYKSQSDPITRAYYSPAERLDFYSNLSYAFHFERQLEALPGEAALGREMAFVYLVAIFDAFIGRWAVDMGVQRQGRLASATPEFIRKVCRKLKMPIVFPADFDDRLDEMRARRNVLVHRGGIADTEYCIKTGRTDCLGQRLDVTEEDLNQVEDFIADFVWTEIIPKSPPRSSAEDP
jgi:hypothetical protein